MIDFVIKIQHLVIMAAPPSQPPMNTNLEIPGGPPMPNVLYPHHVGLTAIILVYHREPSVGGATALHPKVRMRMLRVLAREIGEASVTCDRHVISN